MDEQTSLTMNSINVPATGGNSCNSSANASDLTLEKLDSSQLSGFLAYFFILLLIEAVAFALIVPTIATLCCIKKIQGALAIFLANQLVACVLVLSATGIILLNAIALTIRKMSTGDAGVASSSLPPLALCQLYVWLYGFGSIGRLWSMLAFSVIVLVTVKYGQKVFKHVHFVLGIAGVWIIAFLLNLHITLPYPLYAVHYVDDVICSPRDAIVRGTIVYPAVWLALGGVVPLGVSIAVPIITLFYIKRNTVSQDSHYNKRIARFALFLVVGNIMNLLGLASPILSFLQSEAMGFLLNWLFISVALLSVLPAPVIIIVYMKPVQEKMKTPVYLLLAAFKSSQQSRLPSSHDVSQTTTAVL